VEVSDDGVTWERVGHVPPADTDVTTDVDLTPFAGRLIDLRFAFDAVPGIGVAPDGWPVDDIRVLVVRR